MNETTMNQGCMYDSVETVSGLNKVEGFDPRQYMRKLQNEGAGTGTIKWYLDVAYRKLWFRLKYPTGKIVKKLIKLSDQMAIVEAKVYLDRNDGEENFISNAMAQKYYSATDAFGVKYVELAETAAVGRALADAGFGLQFADLEGESDPTIVDAGIESRMEMGNGSLPDGTYMEEELLDDIGTGQAYDENNLPGQHDIQEYVGGGSIADMRMQEEQLPTGNRDGTNPATLTGRSFPAGDTTSPKQTEGKGKGSDSKVSIDKTKPVDEIYALINSEIAASVVVGVGFNNGKTLGQVALEKPQSLSWYVTDYKGPDNLLRAAAKFLLNAASGKAA